MRVGRAEQASGSLSLSGLAGVRSQGRGPVVSGGRASSEATTGAAPFLSNIQVRLFAHKAELFGVWWTPS